MLIKYFFAYKHSKTSASWLSLTAGELRLTRTCQFDKSEDEAEKRFIIYPAALLWIQSAVTAHHQEKLPSGSDKSSFEHFIFSEHMRHMLLYMRRYLSGHWGGSDEGENSGFTSSIRLSSSK